MYCNAKTADGIKIRDKCLKSCMQCSWQHVAKPQIQQNEKNVTIESAAFLSLSPSPSMSASSPSTTPSSLSSSSPSASQTPSVTPSPTGTASLAPSSDSDYCDDGCTLTSFMSASK